MAYDFERERNSLRRQRVAIRERIAKSWRIGDVVDRQNYVAEMKMQLAGTEKRWAELHAMLGEQHRLRGPVRLDRSSTVANAAARRAQPAQRRTVPISGYMTKIMVPGR
jgi:hypothetical protein